MKRVRTWSIAGAIFTLITGTLLHFVHDWSGSSLTALFGAVNESTWEHLKLFFWPVVLFGVAEFFAYGREEKAFFPAKICSILLGMATIVTLFYTYTGILGRNITAVDISTFVIGTIVSYAYFYRQLRTPGKWMQQPAAIALSIFIFAGLLACFLLFTRYPPHLGLFLDPVSGLYGL